MLIHITIITNDSNAVRISESCSARVGLQLERTERICFPKATSLGRFPASSSINCETCDWGGSIFRTAGWGMLVDLDLGHGAWESRRLRLVSKDFWAPLTIVSFLWARVRAALILSHWTAMCNGVSLHPSGCHAEAGLRAHQCQSWDQWDVNLGMHQRIHHETFTWRES